MLPDRKEAGYWTGRETAILKQISCWTLAILIRMLNIRMRITVEGGRWTMNSIECYIIHDAGQEGGYWTGRETGILKADILLNAGNAD